MAGFDGQERAGGDPGDQRRVGQAHHRRGVQEHDVELLGGVVGQRLQARTGQEFGGARRHGAAWHHEQVRPSGRLHRLGKPQRPGQEVGDAPAVVRADRLVQGRIAQVHVHQERPHAQAREALGQGDRAGGLAFLRSGAGDGHDPGGALLGGELQRAPDRIIGLREGRADIRQRLDRLHALVQQGDAAQHRQAKLALHVCRLADGLVHGLKKEGEGDAQRQARHPGHRQVVHRARLGRPARRLGPVDDGDVVGGDAARDADLLVPLQEPVIERAVGVHLALEDVVLDFAVAGVQHRSLQVGHVGLQGVLLLLRGQILGLQRGADGVGGGLQLPVDLVELALQLTHVRIVGLVGLQLVFVLPLQLGPLLPQRLDGGVRQDVGGGEVGGVLGGAPALLGLDPGGLGGGQGRVELTEVGRVQRLRRRRVLALSGLGDLDDLLLGGVGDELALGFLKLGLQLGDVVLEELAGIGRGLEPPIQVGFDEAVREGVGDARRELRIRAVEGQPHQPGITHREDPEVAFQETDGAALAHGRGGRGVG